MCVTVLLLVTTLLAAGLLQLWLALQSGAEARVLRVDGLCDAVNLTATTHWRVRGVHRLLPCFPCVPVSLMLTSSEIRGPDGIVLLHRTSPPEELMPGDQGKESVPRLSPRSLPCQSSSAISSYNWRLCGPHVKM